VSCSPSCRRPCSPLLQGASSPGGDETECLRNQAGPLPYGWGAEPLVAGALTPETIATLDDRLDLVVRLGAARDAGVLTDEEFGREENRLLGV
jgi:hypothetical protein